jgi:hypothetical protein
MAARAVAEMRSVWAGPDFEIIARRWEQEAAPRLTDVSTALSTMAAHLRAQAQDQRLTSSAEVTSADVSGGTALTGGVAVAGVSGAAMGGASMSGAAMSVGAGGDSSGGVRGGQRTYPRTTADGTKDHVNLTVAQGDSHVDVSALSLQGQSDRLQFELSAAKAEAAAGYSAGLDGHGNLAASADASAGAYLGYAAGRLRVGSGIAKGSIGGVALLGAQAQADASGSIGRDGAEGGLGAEAFAGAQSGIDVSGTIAGGTAAAGAEISYGIGARGKVEAELSTTKVELAMDVGVALGLGGGLTFDVSVSPAEVLADVEHALDK